MGLEFLAGLELEVGGEEVVDVGLALVGDAEGDEGEAAEPDDHGALEVEVEEEGELADGDHEDGPEVVGREDAVEFAHVLVVVGLLELVEVEQPQRRHEHQQDVRPGGRERREAEKELADDLVDDEDQLPVRRPARHDGIGSHPRFEEGHGHNGGDEDEDGGEEEGDAGVDEVHASEALDVGEVGQHLDRGVSGGGVAVDDVEEYFEDGDEEEGDKEGDYLCEQNQGEGEPELLLSEGVADVDDVHDDQHDAEDDQVEEDEEGSVVDTGHEGVDGEHCRQQVEDTVEGLPPVPHHDDREVEGELHHLEVVDP